MFVAERRSFTYGLGVTAAVMSQSGVACSRLGLPREMAVQRLDRPADTEMPESRDAPGDRAEQHYDARATRTHQD